MRMPRNHSINYIELLAEDLEVVKEFYSSAFGWTFTDYGPDYVAFNDGVLDGGFAKGTPKGDGDALVILFSEDLEGSLEKIKACGGTIAKDIYSFPGGRRFHFNDPAGNHLAVWSNT